MPNRTRVDKLMSWWQANKRTVPWRDQSDLYPLAVAEVLLQKTKAVDALPVWQKVIQRFPTTDLLATSDEHEISEIVQCLGLGNQRAKRLKSMAHSLVIGSQSELSGIGPYGSAVLALASGKTSLAVPVDGNIARVICRLMNLHFERGEPRKKPEVKTQVRLMLETRRSPSSRLALIYALVDLGATTCTPRAPACTLCPLAASCAYASLAEVNNRRSSFAKARASLSGTKSETNRI